MRASPSLPGRRGCNNVATAMVLFMALKKRTAWRVAEGLEEDMAWQGGHVGSAIDNNGSSLVLGHA